MVQSVLEIDSKTYYKLIDNKNLLQKFGWEVAKSSFFRPNKYGFYGCNVYHDVSEDRYYLLWERRREPFWED